MSNAERPGREPCIAADVLTVRRSLAHYRTWLADRRERLRELYHSALSESIDAEALDGSDREILAVALRFAHAATLVAEWERLIGNRN